MSSAPSSLPPALDATVQRLIGFLETGDADAALFTDDVFTDFTLPTWRLQAAGRADSVGLRLRGHPGPSRVVSHSVRPTPDGFVMELEERWSDAKDRWYCRECLIATLRGEAICELSVYCTGDWTLDRQKQHAQAVHLLRD
jgi:hypothetical protein